jgi:LacI family transcriptional regulator
LTRSTNYGWALVKESFSHAAAVRMTDVARLAGVSSATVSRVLNGRGNVATVYGRRVLDAVEELGYRPNRLAQNLRRQRTATVGVVVSEIENSHFSEMVRAVEDRAYRRG